MEAEPPIKITDTQPRLCPNCNAKVSSRAKTCLICGIDLEAALVLAEEPVAAPAKPKITLKGILIQVLLTIVGLALLAGIVWGFMAVVREAGRTEPTATPTLEPTRTPTVMIRSTNTPLPPTPTLDANATPLPPREHVVEIGDTLSVIAEDYEGVTVEDIIAFNNLDSDIIQVGQRLLIPAAGATAVPTASGTPPKAGTTPCTIIYVVQSGDTLLGIAQRFGVSMSVIQEMNNIDDPEMLQVGQQLVIPVEPCSTATGGPSPTPTPLPKYPPPPLLSPLDRTEFQGEDASILLQWAATALLRPNEWYLVTIEHVGSSRPTPSPEVGTSSVSLLGDMQLSSDHLQVTTKVTSLRVPVELYPSAQEKQRLFKWSVGIIRQLEDGTYEEASLPGETRSFWWVVPPPTPTPTPGPG